MDVNAVTAALQDLLGPDVTWVSSGSTVPGCWHWNGYYIAQDGALYHDETGGIGISAADLDKLHAASQIVRRMAGEAS